MSLSRPAFSSCHLSQVDGDERRVNRRRTLTRLPHIPLAAHLFLPILGFPRPVEGTSSFSPLASLELTPHFVLPNIDSERVNKPSLPIFCGQRPLSLHGFPVSSFLPYSQEGNETSVSPPNHVSSYGHSSFAIFATLVLNGHLLITRLPDFDSRRSAFFLLALQEGRVLFPFFWVFFFFLFTPTCFYEPDMPFASASSRELLSTLRSSISFLCVSFQSSLSFFLTTRWPAQRSPASIFFGTGFPLRSCLRPLPFQGHGT